MLRKPIFALWVASLFIFPPAVFSEIKEMISEGTYNMGDGETPSVAESRALLQAKRMALEEAGTYVESYSKVKNLVLTEDEIKVLASGIMEVTVLDKKRALVGDGFQFWVKIKARINPVKMEEIARQVKEKSVVEDYKRVLPMWRKDNPTRPSRISAKHFFGPQICVSLLFPREYLQGQGPA